MPQIWDLHMHAKHETRIFYITTRREIKIKLRLNKCMQNNSDTFGNCTNKEKIL